MHHKCEDADRRVEKCQEDLKNYKSRNKETGVEWRKDYLKPMEVQMDRILMGKEMDYLDRNEGGYLERRERYLVRNEDVYPARGGLYSEFRKIGTAPSKQLPSKPNLSNGLYLDFKNGKSESRNRQPAGTKFQSRSGDFHGQSKVN
jgi:hypothetical protein